MLRAIPWDTIGPIATTVIIILLVVFWFIIKLKKLERERAIPASLPKDVNQTGRKTLCFSHEGKIAANTEAIKIFGGALKEANKANSEQHGKLFDKCEELGIKMGEMSTNIIREIQKVNGEQ